MSKAGVSFTLKNSDNFTCPDEEYSEATAKLYSPEYKTGQLIFVEDTGQIYLDYHNKRMSYGENPLWINDVEP